MAAGLPSRAAVLALSLMSVLSSAAPVIDTAMKDDGIVRSFSDLKGKPYSVTYNSRSMLVGGKPVMLSSHMMTLFFNRLLILSSTAVQVLLLSGSVHYVRSTPSMWPSIFAKMKAAGMNAVST